MPWNCVSCDCELPDTTLFCGCAEPAAPPKKQPKLASDDQVDALQKLMRMASFAPAAGGVATKALEDAKKEHSRHVLDELRRAYEEKWFSVRSDKLILDDPLRSGGAGSYSFRSPGPGGSAGGTTTICAPTTVDDVRREMRVEAVPTADYLSYRFRTEKVTLSRRLLEDLKSPPKPDDLLSIAALTLCDHYNRRHGFMSAKVAA